MRWLRRRYGAGPVHLIGLSGCFLIAAYALAKVSRDQGWEAIVVWFAVCVVAHDLVAWPVYGLADRIALRVQERRPVRPAPLVPWINYLRVPTVISVLLFVMFFPLILRLSDTTYLDLTGFTEDVYVWNWLAVTAVLFVGSAVAYLLRWGLARRRASPEDRV